MPYDFDLIGTGLFIAGFIVVLTVFGAFLFGVKRVKGRPQFESPQCGNCGYSLAGLSASRCPECGRWFSSVGVSLPEFPRPRYPASSLILWIGPVLAADVVMFSLTGGCLWTVPGLLILMAVVTKAISIHDRYKMQVRRWQTRSSELFLNTMGIEPASRIADKP